jgi:hypothetical protein
MQKKLLIYDESLWQERPPRPENTLQLFITDRCNLRCKGCFYDKRLGSKDMSLDEYKNQVAAYLGQIGRVTLLGGEPTMHPQLEGMIGFNREHNLKTTVYTNGFDLDRLKGIGYEGISLRIGVHGRTISEKPLSGIKRTSAPVTIVYMLDKANQHELMGAAEEAARDFNLQSFYVSSIRRIDVTKNFWIDDDTTLPLAEYCDVAQNFVDNCPEGIKRLDISRRGLLYTEATNSAEAVKRCRFGNLFPNGDKIICPLDISLNKLSNNIEFDKRECTKNSECLLQKIVLIRK